MSATLLAHLARSQMDPDTSAALALLSKQMSDLALAGVLNIKVEKLLEELREEHQEIRQQMGEMQQLYSRVKKS